MSRAAHSLRHRLVAAFALFALATALCFSAFCLLFVYVVEDRFFNNLLTQEAAHQKASLGLTGRPATPLRSFVSVHRSAATLPPELARALAGGARGSEFPGDEGRHYHVRKVAVAGAEPLRLVAEVSRELVVRPSLPFIVRFLGLSILAILAITLAVGYCLARRATAPLVRLTALVSGALPARLPNNFAHEFPENEIGALAATLEQAMGRIAGFIEREQHFTRDASHELRTPLTVIDGAAQLLARQPLPALATAQVQRIRSASVHMAQTVNTLLELAREEDDAPAPQVVALLPVVETAVVTFAHLLDGKSVEVSVDVVPENKVNAHEAVLAILLGNLISNAFAHTNEGVIRISLRGRSVTVEDSGPGIAPALKGRLYQSGVKGEGSAGFGLGLSIASRLAARYGIALSIDDGAHGGCRATLIFPEP